MALTWDEIREHLRKTFQVVRDDDEAMALTWSAQINLGEVTQSLGMAPMIVDERPWLTMVCEISLDEGFPLRTAMLYQDRLAFGGLVLRRGMYLLRHGVALDAITMPELEWTIRTMVNEAARMRVNLSTKSRPPGDAFTNYED